MAETDNTGLQAQKKIKLDDSNAVGDCDKSALSTFQGFQVTNVLNDKPNEKVVFLHGRFKGSDEDAVVILEKTAFNKGSLGDVLSEDTRLNQTLHNDIYSTYEGFPKPELNAIKTTVIYPATQKHIDKYSQHEPYMVNETAEDYRTITRPHIESKAFSIQWVYNILEKKTESDRIVFEDNDPKDGFILLPDMKWDRKQIQSLYLVAIVHHHGVKSLRDLSPDHLPMLKNILVKSQENVQEKFGVPPSQLRIYVHYQPSYYHFHVHVTHIKYDAPGHGVERAHLLSEVIQNIEGQADYYQTRTLSYVVREGDDLHKKFKEAGKL
ncbi:m7GpppX diphosphatase-like [Lineus longissimus]|uniref:m7GpppX diphosphatase-like n=1 Tax=Lineus longissimus TaxID=88925 RepID=UPI00315CDA2E